MQHPIRFAVALSGLAVLTACADSPVSPVNAAEPKVATTTGTAAGSSTALGAEYDWTFNQQILDILAGEHMVPEARKDQTVIVPGDVKWVEYNVKATRYLPAAYANATNVTKDASARIDEQLVQGCKNVFPSIICTWGTTKAPAFFPYTIDEGTDRLIIVDMHNYYVCGEDFSIVNHATLTELGPSSNGAALQVRPAETKLLVKTGACPPKPKNPGCTYTQGYWKNHAWPVHPAFPPSTLETWEADNGWSEFEWKFFDTNTEWKAMLSVQPRGDAYYILAHQYIAAILNQQNGAYVPQEVRETLVKAYEYFSKSAAERASVSRNDLTTWAGILDRYNNGQLGVPHCG